MISMNRRSGVHWDVFAAGSGALIADSVLNPLEVIKLRVQAKGQTTYAGPVDCARSISRAEGLLGLWGPGLVATWIRSYTYTAARVGLYPTVRAFYSRQSAPESQGATSLLLRVAAGSTTGAFASMLFSPVDLVRIRMSLDAGLRCQDTGLLTTGLRKGKLPRYPNTLSAFRMIAQQEGGLVGLWKGCSAHMLRAATLSGTQLASYDTFKVSARDLGAEEGALLHVTASLLSGFVGQTAAMPIDTVRTRMMTGSHVVDEGVLSCIQTMWASEGFKAFFRGYLPALIRQGPIMVLQMPLVEQIRYNLGIGYI